MLELSFAVAFHKIHTNEECTSTKSSLQLENPENNINIHMGYFFVPPSAACFSAAFFCFSLIIAASLNRMKQLTLVRERK